VNTTAAQHRQILHFENLADAELKFAQSSAGSPLGPSPSPLLGPKARHKTSIELIAKNGRPRQAGALQMAMQ
jgi:hypothetical protein